MKSLSDNKQPYEYAENEELTFSPHSPPRLEETTSTIVKYLQMRNALRQLGYSDAAFHVLTPYQLDLVLRYRIVNQGGILSMPP